MTSCNTYSRDPLGGYDSDLLTKLVNNYRSHKNIIEIPNQLFYDNELNECAGDFRWDYWNKLPIVSVREKLFPLNIPGRSTDQMNDWRMDGLTH